MVCLALPCLYVPSRCAIKKVEPEDKTRVSALSQLIKEALAKKIDDDANSDAEGVQLTIYLPDRSGLTVSVKESSNFKQVIAQILVAHEKQAMKPALVYRDPGMYELRIHEGKLKLYLCYGTKKNRTNCWYILNFTMIIFVQF